MTGIFVLVLLIFACPSIYGQVQIYRPKVMTQIVNGEYLRSCFPVKSAKKERVTTFFKYKQNLTIAEYDVNGKDFYCSSIIIEDSLHPLPNGIRVGQSYSKIASILKMKLKNAPHTIEIRSAECWDWLLTHTFSDYRKCSNIEYGLSFQNDID
jgi:hypothetical protein